VDVVEERIKILRFLNELTGRVGLRDFAQRSGMSRGSIIGYVRGLVRAGYINKVGRGYSISADGKIALKELSPVPQGMEFKFYTETGQPTGLSAKSFGEFCDLVKKVDVKALEFHVSRGDFENWLKGVFNDVQLAQEMAKIRESKLAGEDLRKEIVGVTTAKYSKLKKLLA
jgi:transcriptional regulator with XRE-family HTH domain